MATRMLQRRGTAAEWAAANPVLGDGELGLETDTKILKIGDGVTAWASLTSGYLRVGAKAADSELLDGLNSTDFLRATGKAVDSELLDGLDSTAFMLATAKKRVRVVHTWTIAGEVKIASGDTSYIPPFFIPVPAGQTVSAVGARHRINSGTSATISVQRNGLDLADWVGRIVTTTATTINPTPATLADGDMMALVVTAVSAVPKNMSFSLYLDYTS